MSDFKSKLPDLKELGSMGEKLFKGLKSTVTEIIDDYKKKHESTAQEEAKATVKEVEEEAKATVKAVKEEAKATVKAVKEEAKLDIESENEKPPKEDKKPAAKS